MRLRELQLSVPTPREPIRVLSSSFYIFVKVYIIKAPICDVLDRVKDVEVWLEGCRLSMMDVSLNEKEEKEKGTDKWPI